jgi:hypothetical protein
MNDQLDYPSGTPAWLIEACDAINEELRWFTWEYPGGGDNRGEVSIDTTAGDGDEQMPKWLRLDVWVADNEDPDDERVKPLRVLVDVFSLRQENAREQIRGLIHGFLTHESDEQMFFGPNHEMTFDPHAHERAS